MGGGEYNISRLLGGGAGAGVGSTKPLSFLGVTADGLLGAVPAGYAIEIINTMETGGVAVDIDYGTTALGTEIVPAIPIAGNASDLTGMLFNPNADESGFNIYVSNNLAWGAASLDIYIILRKIK